MRFQTDICNTRCSILRYIAFLAFSCLAFSASPLSYIMHHNIQNKCERGVVIYVSSIVLTWKVYLQNQPHMGLSLFLLNQKYKGHYITLGNIYRSPNSTQTDDTSLCKELERLVSDVLDSKQTTVKTERRLLRQKSCIPTTETDSTTPHGVGGLWNKGILIRDVKREPVTGFKTGNRFGK